MLKGMIKAKRFEQIEPLGRVIDQMYSVESAAATLKMQSDYDVADQRLNKVYRMERVAIEGKEETKLSDMIRTRDRELAPVYTKIETVKREREAAVAYQKKVVGWDLVRKGKLPQKTQGVANGNGPFVPPFVRNPRLSVPVFLPQKRNTLSRPLTAAVSRPKSRASLSQ
jgi:hypothetical protein